MFLLIFTQDIFDPVFFNFAELRYTMRPGVKYFSYNFIREGPLFFQKFKIESSNVLPMIFQQAHSKFKASKKFIVKIV